MFGGSPTKVAVPPIFELIICAIRKGLTSTFNCEAMLKVIGTVNKTVVTLSKSAEQVAVSKLKATSNLTGSALTFFADQIAKKLKSPVSLVMFTIIIIPIKSPSVLKSM